MFSTFCYFLVFLINQECLVLHTEMFYCTATQRTQDYQSLLKVITCTYNLDIYMCTCNCIIQIILALWKSTNYPRCYGTKLKCFWLWLIDFFFHASFEAFGSELFPKLLKFPDDTIFILPKVEDILTYMNS